MFYANINTKCFFSTLNIFFKLVLFYFLFYFTLDFCCFYLVGLNHNGSCHRADKSSSSHWSTTKYDVINR